MVTNFTLFKFEMDTEKTLHREENCVELNNACSSCAQPITDKFVAKILDKVMHESCVRCFSCNSLLKDTCHLRDSKIYCKEHFFRCFGVKCAICKEGINPSDMVRKLAGKVIHIACLRCSLCSKEAVTGDQLYITENFTFVCKEDFENKVRSFEGSEKSYSSCMSDESLEKSPGASLGPSDDEDEANRRRGPRTTIKAKQLDALKASFSVTPKPSRHLREKLAKDTGLTMRVIQVWFQNRRSKERRLKHQSIKESCHFKVTDKCEENFNTENHIESSAITHECSQHTLYTSRNIRSIESGECIYSLFPNDKSVLLPLKTYFCEKTKSNDLSFFTGSVNSHSTPLLNKGFNNGRSAILCNAAPLMPVYQRL